jgi:hypothetical protein
MMLSLFLTKNTPAGDDGVQSRSTEDTDPQENAVGASEAHINMAETHLENTMLQ